MNSIISILPSKEQTTYPLYKTIWGSFYTGLYFIKPKIIKELSKANMLFVI